MSGLAVFESFDPLREGWSLTLHEPRKVISAFDHRGVLEAINEVQEAVGRGCWAAVAIAYEAAPAFEPKLAVHPTREFPLAWVGIYDQPGAVPAASKECLPETARFSPSVTADEYLRTISRIKSLIAEGETYQINYSFPIRMKHHGKPWTLYRTLGRAQGGGYSVFLDLEKFCVLSFSPELFFERQGSGLMTRPMKGTISRGRWPEEDVDHARRLAACPKNRAENVMIVDLLRNDMGKISEWGSVEVHRLFEVERYPTLWQMTSTIKSVCRPGTTLIDIFRALFPCGSVTGAPKKRSMEIIKDLELHPRGMYTGAIGFVKPGGDCIFNVAIRTLVLEKESGEGVLGVGSGVTADSDASDEYEECLLKARFIHHHPPAFDLLETLLLEEGAFFLLDRHIERIKASAQYFGFHFVDSTFREYLDDLCGKYCAGRWRVRLVMDRQGHLRSEVAELKKEEAKDWNVGFAPQPVRRSNPFFFHKTTHREFYDNALAERPHDDDVVLWNEEREVTESTRANIVMIQDGKKWTPPLDAGLLPGTYRAELLSAGEIQERVITQDDLLQCESFFLINSVRKWIPAVWSFKNKDYK
jgi:para-aminobenzoate synthetase/4-amino-4-deoxychorismate lyase